MLLDAAPSAAWAPVAHATSAAMADVAACTVRVPFELIKQRLQMGLHTGTLDAARSIYRAGGVRGLYAGFLSTVLREIPFDAIEFALYEGFRSHGLRHEHDAHAQPSTAFTLAIGAGAGGIAAAVTTPLDVLKTRLMTQRVPVGHPDHYTGIRDCAARIWREEGAAAFSKGLGPRVAWISVGGAVFFGLYEQARSSLSFLVPQSNKKPTKTTELVD
jgi:solute carrier family 25 S-adenosylmethionine transporter 26